MEVLTIVLSSLFALTSGGGLVVDTVAAKQIRSQVLSVETQAVRIDNSPNYQAAQGKLQKVRIATRGALLQPNLRIEALELETDPIDLNLQQLDIDSLDSLRASLDKPFQGAVRLVLTEADLNWALQSPEVLAQIQSALNHFIVSKAGSTNIAYQLEQLQLSLLPDNRLGVNLSLTRPRNSLESDAAVATSRKLNLVLEIGIRVVEGKTIQIIEPSGTVNGRPMSSRLLKGFAEGISDRLNLSRWEQDGILTRILQLEINEDKLELASFLKLETKIP